MTRVFVLLAVAGFLTAVITIAATIAVWRSRRSVKGVRRAPTRPTIGDAIRVREEERRRLGRIRVAENGHMAEPRREG